MENSNVEPTKIAQLNLTCREWEIIFTIMMLGIAFHNGNIISCKLIETTIKRMDINRKTVDDVVDKLVILGKVAFDRNIIEVTEA
jgi:hypothetical protein